MMTLLGNRSIHDSSQTCRGYLHTSKSSSLTHTAFSFYTSYTAKICKTKVQIAHKNLDSNTQIL